MKYNVALLDPGDGTEFWRCFEDPGKALMHALVELGHDVTLNPGMVKDRHNIVLGWNQLEPGAGDEGKGRGYSWTVWQLEQLENWTARFPFKVPFDVLEQADAVWDYDLDNIDYLKTRGIHAEHVPIGYRPEIRAPVDAEKDIDVLLFGCMSPRRKIILKDLEPRCRVEFIRHTEPLFGDDLAGVVARSRVVMNVHYGTHAGPAFGCDECGRIQEQARITPLLSQGACVVTEESLRNYYGDGVVEVAYPDLVDTALGYVEDKGARRRQEVRGLDAIRSMPLEIPVARRPG